MEGTTLGDLVFDRVAADPDLPESVKDLVVAAFESDAALSAALSSSEPESVANIGEGSAPDGPDGVFLRAIRVEGFRGVGPQAVLKVEPGPGLTVITGRNGSGKSSFAEATELALTGVSARWDGKEHNRQQWQDGWHNLHSDAGTVIEVELVAAGRAPSTVRMAWAGGAALGERAWTRQDAGEKRQQLVDGWPAHGPQHRPFLSYSELGALLDSPPTKLHDSLHRLLGLEALNLALDRLRERRTQLTKHVTTMREAKKGLLALLAEVDDARARQAERLLAPLRPDLSAVAELVLGTDGDESEIDRLRALERVSLPEPDEVLAATQDVGAALGAVAETSTADASTARSIAELLAGALQHQREHGDGLCPVCTVGRLDAEWRVRAESRLTDARHRDERLRRAHTLLDDAVDAVRALVTPPPAPLLNPPAGVDVQAVTAAWRSWHDSIRAENPAVLVRDVTAAHERVVETLDDLRRRVRAELVRLDQVWRPVAGRLMSWHDDAQEVAGEAAALRGIKAAEAWLDAAAIDLRRERMAPFEARSKEIWTMLRQESSVELGGIDLVGRRNQRRAVLDVRVDGSPSAALTVMSQGELHALGLSLFLPRATADDSPFRFVMIDDPVQAMDPAKVDGLARVLADVARTHQVIVFSHDDRLAEAVRRLPDAATVVEVQRGERSHVAVAPAFDPVERYLDDARSLVRTENLPDDLRGELVATCCRGALEAAAHTRVWSTRLGRGDRHDDVEDALATAETTRQKLRLAVFDDPNSRDDLHAYLDRALGTWATRTVTACVRGAHGGQGRMLDNLVHDTERIATWLRS